MNRRQFLQGTLGIAAMAAMGRASAFAPPEPTAKKLPRWRGFNLLEKFTKEMNAPYREQDFEWIAEFGFDFVRLPMSYLCWATAENPSKMDEKVLADIDRAIEFGRKHKIHVNLDLHRIPGYCVNPPAEPGLLWQDPKALDAAALTWRTFARRYSRIPNTELSFDLINEPANVSEEVYGRVVRRLVAEIREEDPKRLIVADGLQWGTQPVPSLADLDIAQSTRGYGPMQISHYKASWVGGSDKWAVPTWPLHVGGETWDRALLKARFIDPWKALERKGVGVHVGEWGAFSHTPHAVVLSWMRDQLSLWREAGWGWSMWNFRGSFGPIDSGRTDVAYEDFRGHKLDRQMLDLLRAN